MRLGLPQQVTRTPVLEMALASDAMVVNLCFAQAYVEVLDADGFISPPSEVNPPSMTSEWCGAGVQFQIHSPCIPIPAVLVTSH